ncbi:MAG TPA: Uma2 family endonuclease [Vicinamibacterales bacterium]|nr:Uma2 family endonuclease [Vicinamibacterales bacterium]
MSGSDRVKPAAAGMKLTYDDFVLFPDDGKRHELIDGEHFATPSPNVRHQTIIGALHLLIANHLEAHPTGRVFLSPLDVIFTEFDVVEPDLLYVSHARDEALSGTHVRGVPELVIEVASESTRTRARRSSVVSTSASACPSNGSSIPRSRWSACTVTMDTPCSVRSNSRATPVMC